MTSKVTNKPIISADSHVTEPADMYVGRMPKKYDDTAPRIIRQDNGGDGFLVDGMEGTFPITVASAAGFKLDAFEDRKKAAYADCWAGGWDPKARIADQDMDGVAAEVLYPSLGMHLCNHNDVAYKTACFDAYNSWLAEYCASSPNRLIGLGQTAMATPKQGIKDLETLKKMGMKGVMMPGTPETEDYDSEIYDEFWAAAVDMDMPLSFHIATYKAGKRDTRGPSANSFMNVIRGNQDIIGMMVFTGVFERFPKLKLVCAEADAGWAPHYMYRMDHLVSYQPKRLPRPLARKPSEYFRQNVYMTFQDDEIAIRLKDMFNQDRMMWASDFPHGDSTWPASQDLLARHTSSMNQTERDKLLHDNVAACYNLDVAALA